MGANHNWIGPEMAFRIHVWGPGGAVLSLSLLHCWVGDN